MGILELPVLCTRPHPVLEDNVPVAMKVLKMAPNLMPLPAALLISPETSMKWLVNAKCSADFFSLFTKS